ncbi:hypothetical protein Tsubulata_021435 [Turnera subulata]|uniref:Anaphase-promoting complex subunit 4 WD40 domain-containing protein n=1 Tax=Turnera subulata TaxID=218843 RepID=A0A9Q0JH88_9ROSI|nr:hypothetical protein Tsubulata_021435 [Turnera subulata]
MGKQQPDPPLSLQKYGVPFYSAAWVPHFHLQSKLPSSSSSSSQDHDGDDNNSGGGSTTTNDAPQPYYAVLAGGGGEGRSGIPNAVLLTRFDPASNSLSPQPVAKRETGSDLPYRMVVHPGGDGLICAMPNSCRYYEWDQVKDGDEQKLDLKPSEKVLSPLEDVGQQLALAFNSDSSVLAVGGEDGNLRVLKWPSMEVILNEAQAHTSVKDLSFSLDGKFLVSLGGRGPGRVWDVTSATSVASLSKENDEIFASCRFAQANDNTPILYTAAITGKGGSIATWNTSTWKRIKSKNVVREPISSFNVSPDGKLLAIGTAQGDVTIINAASMQNQMMVKKGHLGIVTAVAFSHDSRALVSASMDSSARVTLVEDKNSGGGVNVGLILLIILLAISAYFMKKGGLLPFLG